MDKKLIELATHYGIEISNTSYPKVIESDGAERLATLEDITEIFGLVFEEEIEKCES